MIGKVLRGKDPAGLLAYLFGPGTRNEHVEQHVVAHWTGLPGEADPQWAGGKADLRALIADMRTDLRAAGRLGAKDAVWHCAVAIPAGDGLLGDGQWREVAEAVAEAVGLEDDRAGAVRWVAVRHGLSEAGNDHIHIVAAAAGRTAAGDAVRRSFRGDYAAVRAVCNRFEQLWGLTRTGSGSGAAQRRPTRAETEIAAKKGLSVEQRVRLERAVRSAAVASRGPQEFAARLAAAGVEARFSRESEQRPGTWLGVTFHTADYTDSAGAPVAFSGRSLARDLSAPALQARWDARAAAAPAGPAQGRVRELADLLAAHAAAGGRLPELRGRIAAAADALWAAADAVEADPAGPFHAAAGEAARAAREPGPADRAAGGPVDALLVAALPGRAALDEDEAELRRAWSVFGRMLRAWARADAGEPARVAAHAAARTEQLLAGPRPAAAAALPAARRRRAATETETRRNEA